MCYCWRRRCLGISHGACLLMSLSVCLDHKHLQSCFYSTIILCSGVGGNIRLLWWVWLRVGCSNAVNNCLAYLGCQCGNSTIFLSCNYCCDLRARRCHCSEVALLISGLANDDCPRYDMSMIVCFRHSEGGLLWFAIRCRSSQRTFIVSCYTNNAGLGSQFSVFVRCSPCACVRGHISRCRGLVREGGCVGCQTSIRISCYHHYTRNSSWLSMIIGGCPCGGDRSQTRRL